MFFLIVRFSETDTLFSLPVRLSTRATNAITRRVVPSNSRSSHITSKRIVIVGQLVQILNFHSRVIANRIEQLFDGHFIGSRNILYRPVIHGGHSGICVLFLFDLSAFGAIVGR